MQFPEEGLTSSELEGSSNESSGGHEVGGGVVSNASDGGVLEKSDGVVGAGGVVRGGVVRGGVIRGGGVIGGVILGGVNWDSTASHGGVLTNGGNEAALVITFAVSVGSAGAIINLGVVNLGVVNWLGVVNSGGVVSWVLGKSDGSEGKDSRVFEHDVVKLRFDLYLIIIIHLKQKS